MPQKGYKQTEEHKRKLKEHFKGTLGKHWKVNKKGIKNLSKSAKLRHQYENYGFQKGNKNWFKIEYPKGERAYHWIDGRSSKNHCIRTSSEYKLWRKSCFERDNFTCQKCEQYGGELRVHHINNFADFPELRFALDNGITFCKKCHQNFHKKYGIKNNTKEQLDEFLNKYEIR